MQIECSCCGELWDTAHLRSQAAFETDHTDPGSWQGDLDSDWRQHFAGAGYQFGATVAVLHRCPRCMLNKVEEVEEVEEVEDWQFVEVPDVDRDFAGWNHPEIFIG